MTNADTNERNEGELSEDELGKVAGGLNARRNDDVNIDPNKAGRGDENTLDQEKTRKTR